ncbi:hypothetical protein NA78x_000622 [Anatilimnocola sp. NA78]|uniref:hypothetical protein n=1 Tax=Anatilimnocola sp. NA78 TaxID=3415683 RepID=UPI003CE49341
MRAHVLFTLACVLTLATSATAAPPWAQLIPFQRKAAPVRTVAAEVDYSLTEKHGPWLILCTTFVGSATQGEGFDDPPAEQLTGEEQAHAFARELRRKHGMQAYVFRQHFDYTQTEVGLGFNKFGGQKKMKPRRAVEFDEFAVMVGNFESVNDPALEKTLAQIKVLKPAMLTQKTQQPGKQASSGLSQPLDRIREYYQSLYKSGDARKLKGPMAKAFVTRNPLLPDEYFVAKGLDPFIVDLNKNIPHSLLRNPKKYSVKVATFRGVDTMKPKEFEQLTSQRQGDSKIDIAALNANKLCAALREKGIEAYEFHDTSESIVTIGSFDSVGEERADGKTEIDPGVHRIMKEYSAEHQAIPGMSQLGVIPKKLAGINFDAQPIPVEVPRQSLAANYNSTNGSLR